MKKEWLLLSISVLATLIAALGIIRWMAPGLLGVPVDLQLVQIDEKLPPFYEGAFRREKGKDGELMLQDPLMRVRARPFLQDMQPVNYGPHDMLGFRNYSVPNVVDVVAIGDSQTYGNNVFLGQNWPSNLADRLAGKNLDVYNMSTGGWGAVQYLGMFSKAVSFQPRVIVIAFYSGNDPLESFRDVYGNEHWGWLKPDQSLSPADIPPVEFPAPESEWWEVVFNDNVKTIFTPLLRYSSNSDLPVVNAGYEIMARVAQNIGDVAGQTPIKIIFTIIPTKELVYAEKVKQESLVPPESYTTLVEGERRHIGMLEAVIKNLPGVEYVDVVTKLQQAALGPVPLYPSTIDGHPVFAGYQVIGNTIADHVSGFIDKQADGLLALEVAEGHRVYLLRDNGLRMFESLDLILQNGWAEANLKVVKSRDIAGYPFLGNISEVDPDKYGPLDRVEQ
jgi:lysophospholipase L1-like esterase